MPINPRNHPPQEGSPFARHIPALDGIRGLAALGVVFSHVFPGTPHNRFETVLRNLSAFGALGVDLFFVLSGFLITGILYDTLSDHAFFRTFYIRRALRIFPLYYGVLAVFAVAAILKHWSFHGELLSLSLYMQNNHLIAPPIFEYTGPPQLPLIHFWSLAIEEQFYIIWPVAVFLLRDKTRILITCGLFMVLCPLLRAEFYLHGVSSFTINNGTLTRVDSLLAGAALAILLRTQAHAAILNAGKWLVSASILALVLSTLALQRFASQDHVTAEAIPKALDHTFVALISVGIIALALHAPVIRRAFTNTALRWIGKYSYGIYVLHVILFTYLEGPLRRAITTHLTANRAIGVVLAGLLCLALTLLVAFLSYNIYEKPFLRLKRFFAYQPALPAKTVKA